MTSTEELRSVLHFDDRVWEREIDVETQVDKVRVWVWRALFVYCLGSIAALIYGVVETVKRVVS